MDSCQICLPPLYVSIGPNDIIRRHVTEAIREMVASCPSWNLSKVSRQAYFLAKWAASRQFFGLVPFHFLPLELQRHCFIFCPLEVGSLVF